MVEFTAQALLHCRTAGQEDVVLLLGFEDDDGSMGAPGFTDESPSEHGTGTPSGISYPEVIDTAEFKFGESSLLLPSFGGSDFGLGLIIFDDSEDWQLSTANSDEFTVECWIKFNDFFTDVAVILGQDSGSPQTAWAFEIDGTTRELAFRSSEDGTGFNVNVETSGAALTTGVWYHLAADKDSSGKIRVYVDGVMMGSDTPADSSIFNSNAELSIGCRPGQNGVNGWLDEVRITKGIAHYASDAGFSPPTSAFPRA